MIINGQPEDIATPLSVDELIARKGLNAGRVAVEVNGAIVPRDKRAQTMLSGTDTVEIVTFVQGGCEPGKHAARHRHGLMPMPAREPHSDPNTESIKRHIPQRKVPS